MADCATINDRLARARATYDDWMNGQYVSSFTDQNGERVTYGGSGLSRLRGYIADLEAELAGCTGGQRAYRGPLKFTFGRRQF